MYTQGNVYLDGHTLKDIAFLIHTHVQQALPAGKGVPKKQQGKFKKLKSCLNKASGKDL